MGQQLLYQFHYWIACHYLTLMTKILVFDGVHGYTNPKYIWPLTKDTYNYDVSTSTSGDYSQCGFHFESSPTHPDFTSEHALSLDTIQYPYIDIRISDNNEYKFFSFAMSVKASSAVGCILNFNSDSSATSTIHRFTLCFDSNADLQWTYTHGSEISNSVKVNSGTLNSWNLVIISRNFDTGKVSIKVNAYTTMITDNSMPNKILGLPGTLRVGALSDESSSFTGCIICLSMFDTDDVRNSDKSSIYQECRGYSSVSGLPSTPGSGCATTTTTTTTTTLPTTTEQETTTSLETDNIEYMKSNYYRIIGEDMAPQLSPEKITTLIVSRTGRCASECSKYTDCKSFTVRTVTAGRKDCTLYNTDINLNMASAAGVKTYINVPLDT